MGSFEFDQIEFFFANVQLKLFFERRNFSPHRSQLGERICLSGQSDRRGLTGNRSTNRFLTERFAIFVQLSQPFSNFGLPGSPFGNAAAQVKLSCLEFFQLTLRTGHFRFEDLDIG